MSVPNNAETSSVLRAERGVSRPRKRRSTRPSKAHEAAPWRVAQALVAIDAQRAATPQGWVAAVVEHPDVVVLRRDRRETIARIARAVASASEVGSLLVRRLTWERLAKVCECSRATVARTLALLHDTRLLGRVAPGRSAAFRPSRGGNDTSAETALYVLALPDEPESDPADRVDSGDENETPPNLQVDRNTPARTCTRDTHARSAVDTLRAIIASGRRLIGAEDRALIESLPASDRESFWGIDEHPQTRVEELAAAAELRRRAPVMRRVRARAVRSVMRPFIESGWTVRDVLEAIDRRPDGMPAPHSGAHGVRSPRQWFAARLRAWTDHTGAPTTAPHERRRQQREALLAQSAQDRQQRATDRQRAAANPITDSTRQQLAQARAACRRQRRRLISTH